MSKHGLLFLLSDPVAVNLTPQMSVVLQKFAHVNLSQTTFKILGRNILLVSMAILLGLEEILDHLEGGHRVSIVELGSSIGQLCNQSLISVMLQHHFSKASILVDISLFGSKVVVGTSSMNGGLSASSPLFHHSHARVGVLMLKQFFS